MTESNSKIEDTHTEFINHCLNETQSDFLTFRQTYMIEFYVFPVIIFIGTICNILTFIVMRRKKMRHQSTYFYMAVLAIADEMVLIVGCLNYWIYTATGKNLILVSNLACKILSLLLYATLHFSVWAVVIMTIERFIAVALPLQASHLCTVKRAKLSTIGLMLIILSINLHFLFTHGLVNRNNHLGCQAKNEAFENFMNKIWPWIDASIYSFIPLTLLIIFNILIIYNLLKASKNINKFCDTSNIRNTASSNFMTITSARNSECLINRIDKKRITVSFSERRFQFLSIFCSCLDEDKHKGQRANNRGSSIDSNNAKRNFKFKKNKYSEDSSALRLSTSLPAAETRHLMQINSTNSNNTSTTLMTKQQQQQQAQQSASSRRLTIMLLFVSLTFFITSTPIVTLQTIELAGLVQNTTYIKGFFLVLQYLNHSANFFLYAVTGKTFRREFFALFNPSLNKKGSPAKINRHHTNANMAKSARYNSNHNHNNSNKIAKDPSKVQNRNVNNNNVKIIVNEQK
jgi:hypothetical protein